MEFAVYCISRRDIFSLFTLRTKECRIIPTYIFSMYPTVLICGHNSRAETKQGGNKTRAGTINIATLPRSYAHCTSSRFSPNESEICTWSWQIDQIQLHCTVEQCSDFNKFCCTIGAICAIKQLIDERRATPTKTIVYVHVAGTNQGSSLFSSAQAR